MTLTACMQSFYSTVCQCGTVSQKWGFTLASGRSQTSSLSFGTSLTLPALPMNTSKHQRKLKLLWRLYSCTSSSRTKRQRYLRITSSPGWKISLLHTCLVTSCKQAVDGWMVMRCVMRLDWVDLACTTTLYSLDTMSLSRPWLCAKSSSLPWINSSSRSVFYWPTMPLEFTDLFEVFQKDSLQWCHRSSSSRWGWWAVLLQIREYISSELAEIISLEIFEHWQEVL